MMNDTPEDESMKFEVGIGADMTLTENTMFGAKYLYSSVQLVASDVEVSLSDEGGLVDRLGMGLTWGLFDLNNGDADNESKTENDLMDMLVTGNLSYDLDAMGGTLTPAAELTLNQIDDMDATVGLTVKAVLTDAVPATEFGLQWKTATLFDAGEGRPRAAPSRPGPRSPTHRVHVIGSRTLATMAAHPLRDAPLSFCASLTARGLHWE